MPEGTEQNQENAEGQETEPQTIPKERLAEEIKKREAAEEHSKMVEGQLALFQANAPQAQTQQQTDPTNIVDNIFEGIFDPEEPDIVDPKQFKEVVKRMVGTFGQALSGIQVIAQHSDFNDVVGKHLNNVLKDNPALAQNLKQLQATNPGAASEMAYHLAKTDPAYIKAQAGETPEEKAAREATEAAIEAANRPGSASAAAGAGAIDKTALYSKMTPEDLAALREKVKAAG